MSTPYDDELTPEPQRSEPRRGLLAGLLELLGQDEEPPPPVRRAPEPDPVVLESDPIEVWTPPIEAEPTPSAAPPTTFGGESSLIGPDVAALAAMADEPAPVVEPIVVGPAEPVITAMGTDDLVAADDLDITTQVDAVTPPPALADIEPVMPEPVMPEPVRPEPVLREPVMPAPAPSEPIEAAAVAPEPVLPEAVAPWTVEEPAVEAEPDPEPAVDWRAPAADAPAAWNAPPAWAPAASADVRLPDQFLAAALPEPTPEPAPRTIADPVDLTPAAVTDDPWGIVPEPAAEPMIDASPRAGLASTRIEERLATLSDLLDRPLDAAAIDDVRHVLFDPQPDVRLLALDVLGRQGAAVPAEAFRMPLTDPDDRVRAKAVSLLAAYGVIALDDLLPLVGDRSYPQCQAAALDVLPDMVRTFGIDQSRLRNLLRAVGSLDSAPTRVERPGLAELARAIGALQIIPVLDSPNGAEVLGATWLLSQEGSRPALRAVAGLDENPSGDIRHAASLARRRLREAESERVADPESAEVAARSSAVETWVDPGSAPAPAPRSGSLVPRVAAALNDPDAQVRARARTLLETTDRATVIDWARKALRNGNDDEAGLAARVCEALRLTEVANVALERAAELAADQRGPFYGAVRALQLEPESMVSLLDEVEALRRPEAIRILWQISGRRLLPHIRPLLQDSAGAVRMAVLELIAEFGEASSADTAVHVVATDSSPQARSSALKLLVGADAAHRMRALTIGLSDGDSDVRATAAEVLLPGLIAHDFGLLPRALEDAEEAVWQVAVRYLAERSPAEDPKVWDVLRGLSHQQKEALYDLLDLQGAGRFASLVAVGLDSPNVRDRTLAVELAGRGGGSPELVHLTIEALGDPAPVVRRTAAGRLKVLRTPEAVPALSKAIADPDFRTRVAAVRALGDIDHDGVIPALVLALRDPVGKVRDAASSVLGHWKSTKVARELIAHLTPGNMESVAVELLSQMGPPAVEPLLEVLHGDFDERTDVIGRILTKLVGAEPFLDQMNSRDPSQRLAAADALGAMGGPRPLNALRASLEDPELSVRLRVVGHLARLGGPATIEALERAMANDPVPEVVNACGDALDTLRDDDGLEVD